MKNINQILPADIISDILSRLSAQSVLDCKSVCKTWKNLIQHPKFPKLHLSHLNHPDSSDSGMLRYVFLKKEDDYSYHNKHLNYFEFNENDELNYVKPIPRKIMVKFALEAYIVIGSFNGLICIYGTQPSKYVDDDHGPAIILNPVTREYIVLPEFNWIERSHRACGFGYLAETNEYKVVRIYLVSGKPYVMEVEVYTLGSGMGWRHVGKFDFGFQFETHWEHTYGVFLNGCLHWRNTEAGRMIVVFDLAKEKFLEHIPPPPLRTHEFINDMVIGVSDVGILYYAACQYFEGVLSYDVWLLLNKNGDHVMEQQEEHQSWGWEKVCSLEQGERFAFMKGATVLRYNEGDIKVYVPTTSTWINLGNVTGISSQTFPHKHTLISLKELGEEHAAIMNSQGTEETDSSASGSH